MLELNSNVRGFCGLLRRKLAFSCQLWANKGYFWHTLHQGQKLFQCGIISMVTQGMIKAAVNSKSSEDEMDLQI